MTSGRCRGRRVKHKTFWVEYVGASSDGDRLAHWIGGTDRIRGADRIRPAQRIGRGADASTD